MPDYNPDVHHRRSIRLKGYDYSQGGAYFVTICVQHRICLFGTVVDGVMQLNEAGQMILATWEVLPTRFPQLVLDEFVVMPNHVHGIMMIADHSSDVDRGGGDREVRRDSSGPSRQAGTLPGTVGRIVQAFKSISTHEYTVGVKERGWAPFHGKLWQRNYYERIVRSEEIVERARQYIRNNPARWETDEENTGTRSS